MNLIAYEMCPDFKNDFTFTSYMYLLDLLIDEAEDVKDLREAGILYNGLGSDEEVAKLFNKMNTDLVPSPIIYSGVKRKIHNHWKASWIKHAVQGYRTYFSSPWTCLAFVGAITALLLGALQTYYTIHQQKSSGQPSKRRHFGHLKAKPKQRHRVRPMCHSGSQRQGKVCPLAISVKRWQGADLRA
ncbi:hypothetical protein Gotur_011164 [Gossypium turneri]